MKRLAAFLLLAGLGGGCTSMDKARTSGAKPFNAASTGKAMPGMVGPTGEPVMMAKGPVMQASATTTVTDPNVTRTSGFARVIGAGQRGDDCSTCGVTTPGLFRSGHSTGCNDCGSGGGAYAGRGIVPAPPMGPPGAVAAVGAIGPGMGMPMYSNMRTAIRFIGNGKVTWYAGGNYVDPGLSMPAEYNFAQASIYRLKVTGMKPGSTYYPTLEVYAATPKSVTYLSHGTVPVNFTAEDLARVDAGNMVVKVIYLPDSLYQDVTAIGVTDEIASTQLEPGADPVVEANRRGTILAVIRLGNINLENPNSPAMDAPPQSFGTPGMTPAPGPMNGPTSSGPVTMAPAPMPSIPATPTSNKK